MPDSPTDSQRQTGSQPYRQNVAALLVREDGRMFIGERSDCPGAWQFPQGGIDPGESPEEALVREIGEETSLRPEHFEIVEQRSGYRYRFPDGHSKWKDFCGQEQTYFRCRFTGSDEDIDLDTEHREFSAFRWVAPTEFDIDWLPEFKREVYRRVLADFFGL